MRFFGPILRRGSGMYYILLLPVYKQSGWLHSNHLLHIHNLRARIVTETLYFLMNRDIRYLNDKMKNRNNLLKKKDTSTLVFQCQSFVSQTNIVSQTVCCSIAALIINANR